MYSRLLPLAASVLVAGCVVGEFDEPEVGSQAFVNDDLLRRVVLGRLYQKNDWTLPQAGTTVAERVKYACDRIRPLNPSYVSGLIRLDDDAPLSQAQIDVFNGVRTCVNAGGRSAKFDVVLNAEHYTDNARQPSKAAGRDALKARAREMKDKLGVDIIFFDFFSSPYNGSPEHKDWHPDALTEGTAFIRDTLKLKVGGNVWGMQKPPNADFVALDNFDRASGTDGFEYDKQQIAAMKGTKFVLHIENNPQKSPSKGLQWINGSPEYRRDVLQKFASQQQQAGYSYMFPVFFPLQCCVGTQCGPDQCKVTPSDRIAYDASLDGDMLQRFDAGLAK